VLIVFATMAIIGQRNCFGVPGDASCQLAAMTN